MLSRSRPGTEMRVLPSNPKMRRRAITMFPAVALLATGCFGGSSTTTATTGRPPTPTRGVIVTVGGPAPGLPAPVDRATFKLVSATRTIQVRTDAHGRFTFNAEPGTYRVVITGHAPAADGRFIQPIPDSVTVGRRKPIRLVISIM